MSISEHLPPDREIITIVSTSTDYAYISIPSSIRGRDPIDPTSEEFRSKIGCESCPVGARCFIGHFHRSFRSTLLSQASCQHHFLRAPNKHIGS